MTQNKTRTKNKFARIQTAKELDEAIKSIKSDQKLISEDVGRELRFKREQFQPANLAISAIQHFAPDLSWTDLGLGLVRGLKKLFSPSTKTEKVARLEEKKEEEAAPEEKKAEAKAENKVVKKTTRKKKDSPDKPANDTKA